MKNEADRILKLTSSQEMLDKVMDVVESMDLDKSERNEVLAFYKKRLVKLYEMGLEYTSGQVNTEHQDDEIEDIINSEVQAQLIYWWLEIQSEWIRYNNMLNFKSIMIDENDEVIQAKASICSFFLHPIGELLDKNLINKNTESLANLVKYSKIGAAENTA